MGTRARVKCVYLNFSLSHSFAPYREEIEIPADTREMRLDVILMRDDPQHWSSANDFRVIENVVKTRYHSNPEIRQRLAEFETRSGQIATFGYAESEFGIYYNSIKLTADVSIACNRGFFFNSFLNNACRSVSLRRQNIKFSYSAPSSTAPRRWVVKSL